MFSFFRKSRTDKDQNRDRRPSTGNSFDDGNKAAKVKSDKKTANKDRKIPFRAGTQPAASTGESSSNILLLDDIGAKEPVLEAGNTTRHEIRESESFDEFCEAQESINNASEQPDTETESEFLEANDSVQQQNASTFDKHSEVNEIAKLYGSEQRPEGLDIAGQHCTAFESLGNSDEASKQIYFEIDPRERFEIGRLNSKISREIAACESNAVPVTHVPEQSSQTARRIPIITVSCTVGFTYK